MRDKLQAVESNIFKENISDYFVFTVLRHPFDRLISGYLEVNRRKEISSKEKKFWSIKEPKSRFSTFVDTLKIDMFDEHIIPQSWYLNSIEINKYMSIEDLDNNSFVRDTLMTKQPVKRVHFYDNKSKKSVLELVDGNIIDNIYEIYKEDFDLLREVFA